MRYRDVYPKWRIQENPSPAHAKKRGKLFLENPSPAHAKKRGKLFPFKEGSPDARFLPRLAINSTLAVGLQRV